MSEKINTDKAIREKFEDFSVEPPVHLWGEISAELAARKKRLRVAYISWISAAAVVVFAFLAGWMINEKSISQLPEITAQQNAPEPKEDTATFPAKSNKIQADEEASAFTAPVSEAEKEVGNASRQYKLVVGNRIKKDEPTTVTSFIQDREKIEIEVLSGKKAELGTQEEAGLTVSKTQSIQEGERSLSESDQKLVASNIQNKRENGRPEHGWIVGAHLSPGYSAHTSSYSSGYAQEMENNLSGGTENMGGGFSVQYKTGKRLRVESGVYYAQNSQSSRSTNSLFASSPSYDFANITDNADGEILTASPVEVQSGGVAMNSTAGVMNITQIPEGAELSAANSSDYAKNNATLLSSGEFSQQFDFIEIPMYLRYRVVDSKLGIDLMGGLNAGIVVGNNVYLENNYGRQNVGNTADISTLNLSGTVGIGMNYSLGRHVSFSLEPRLNYYLNSINTDPDVTYKPYRFGLFTGVYYAF